MEPNTAMDLGWYGSCKLFCLKLLLHYLKEKQELWKDATTTEIQKFLHDAMAKDNEYYYYSTNKIVVDMNQKHGCSDEDWHTVLQCKLLLSTISKRTLRSSLVSGATKQSNKWTEHHWEEYPTFSIICKGNNNKWWWDNMTSSIQKTMQYISLALTLSIGTLMLLLQTIAQTGLPEDKFTDFYWTTFVLLYPPTTTTDGNNDTVVWENCGWLAFSLQEYRSTVSPGHWQIMISWNQQINN